MQKPQKGYKDNHQSYGGTRFVTFTVITKFFVAKEVHITVTFCENGNKEEADMANDTENNKKKWEVAGIMIPAGLFIGMGIGWAFGYLVQGLFIGLGAGFVAMAIIRLKAS